MTVLGLSATMVALPVRAAFSAPTTQVSTSPASPPAVSPLDILQNSRSDQEQRDAAALKVVASHDDAVRPVLTNILNGTDPGAQLAVARALGIIPWPEPEFVEPLFQLLYSREAQQERVRAAAGALSQYKTMPDVLQRLITVATSDQSEDIRAPVIRAVGTFDQKVAAQTLIDLQQATQSPAIERAAGDGLIEMTGLNDFGHNAQKWKQWWSQNSQRSEADFQTEIRKDRADEFEREVERQSHLQSAVEKVLVDAYDQAAPADRADLLIRYLRSSSGVIRALGATIVFNARTSPDGAPPGTMAEVRGMLDDVSSDVRAAVADALYNDADSAPAMVRQLALESDDLVRHSLVHSLAPLRDPAAVALMIQLVHTDPSQRVCIDCAQGIASAANLITNDRDLEQQTFNALNAALASTGEPGTQSLRAAVVDAMASLHDARLLTTFKSLLNPGEPVEVRKSALKGLGNLQDPDVGDMIADNLQDDNPDIRLATITALGTVVQPLYLSRLVDKMSTDPDDSVKQAAWQVVHDWIPSLNEHDLASLADSLKTSDPSRELEALRELRDRLDKDVHSATDDTQRNEKERDLATMQQNIGDISMNVSQFASAAAQYKAALDYWKNNGGQPDVIDTLSGDVVRAYLKAEDWNDAADFASSVISEYDQNATMKFTQETVSREFKIAAEDLYSSDDPGSYDKAVALFAAAKKMAPPLAGSYPDQLEKIQQDFEQKHAAQKSTTPGS